MLGKTELAQSILETHTSQLDALSHSLYSRIDENQVTISMVARPTDEKYVMETTKRLIAQLPDKPTKLVIAWNRSKVPMRFLEQSSSFGVRVNQWNQPSDNTFLLTSTHGNRSSTFELNLLDQSQLLTSYGKIGALNNIALLLSEESFSSVSPHIIQIDAESQFSCSPTVLLDKIQKHPNTLVGATNLLTAYQDYLPNERIPIALQQEKKNLLTPLIPGIWGSGYAAETLLSLSLIMAMYKHVPGLKNEDSGMEILARFLGRNILIDPTCHVTNKVPPVWEHKDSNQQIARWDSTFRELLDAFGKPSDGMETITDIPYSTLRNKAAIKMLSKAIRYQANDKRSFPGATTELLVESGQIINRKLALWGKIATTNITTQSDMTTVADPTWER